MSASWNLPPGVTERMLDDLCDDSRDAVAGESCWICEEYIEDSRKRYEETTVGKFPNSRQAWQHIECADEREAAEGES